MARHDCIIEGHHKEDVPIRPCGHCFVAVCAEHMGIHWERAHKGRR